MSLISRITFDRKLRIKKILSMPNYLLTLKQQTNFKTAISSVRN